MPYVVVFGSHTGRRLYRIATGDWTLNAQEALVMEREDEARRVVEHLERCGMLNSRALLVEEVPA